MGGDAFLKGGATVLLLLVLVLSLGSLAQAADTYFDVQAPMHAEPNTTIYISGNIVVDGVGRNQTITAWFGNASNTSMRTNSTSSVSGAFNMSVTVPAAEGGYNLTVNSSLGNRSLVVMLDYFQSASFEFIGNLPPFSPGDNVNIKTTVKYSNGTAIPNHNVTMGVFRGNGVQAAWGAWQTNMTDSSGVTYHNFNISSTASAGTYIAYAWGGHLVFTVKVYSLAASTLDSNYQPKTYFGASETVNIQAKLRNGTNDPVVGATAWAIVKDPNNALAGNVSLTSSANGTYNNSFTNISSTGTYSVTVYASIDGATEETSTTFTVQTARVTLSPSTFGAFFEDWGNKKVSRPGSNISLDVKAFDVVNGTFLSVSDGSNKGVNCSSVVITSVTNAVTGADVTSQVVGPQISTSYKFMGDSMCSIEITTSSTAGIYMIQINVSVNASSFNTYAGTGFFSTQNYVLSVSPTTRVGRDAHHVLLKPGNNATFKLQVRNISSSATLGVGNLSSVSVREINPMGGFSFGASSRITNVSYWFDSNTDKLTVLIPTNASGPSILTVQGTVGGETITGDGFFIAVYLMGFVGPQGGGMMDEGGEAMGAGEGGPGGGPGGPMGGNIASCSGTMEMFGMAMDVETEQPQENVLLTLREVRDEITGQDVSSCFTSAGARTGSNGFAYPNLTVSASCSLSGFYFMLWTARWENYTDTLPGGFMCKNLNFWPSPVRWDIGLESCINLSVSNIVYTDNTSKFVTNGTVEIARLINFEPSRGPTVIDVSGAPTAGITAKTNYLYFCPANFTTLANNNNNKWYSGFYDAQIRVRDNVTGTQDTAFGGWGVFPFQAYFTDPTIWSWTWSPGDRKNVTIWSENNITAVKARRMSFMSGEPVDMESVANATSANPGVPGLPTGGYIVSVNFTLPSTLSKGDGMIIITLTDNNSESTTVDVFSQISTFSVVAPMSVWPDNPGYGLNSYRDMSSLSNVTLNTSAGGPGLMRAWNLSYIIQQFGAWSKTSNANPAVGGEYCIFQNPFNISQHILTVDNATAGTWDIVFVKNNNTVGNGTNISGPYTATSNIGATLGAKHYISSFEYCVPLIFSANSSDYTGGCSNPTTNVVCEQGGWSTEWGWGGRHRINENFTIPYWVGTNPAEVNATVTVSDIAGANFDRKGFTGTLSSSDYQVYSNKTDSNGVAFVKVNVSQSGMFRTFWRVTTTSGIDEYASFDNALIFQISQYQAWGQWYGTSDFGGKMVNTTDNLTVQVMVQYFNGTKISAVTDEVNVSLSFMEFSVFGPPTSGTLTFTNVTNGSVITTPVVKNGQVVFNITAASGWPQSSYGTCVDIQGTVNAPSGLGSENIFVGSVCTPPL